MKNIIKNTLFIFLSAVILSGCGDGGLLPTSIPESLPESESGSGSTVNVQTPAVPPVPLPDPLTGDYSLKECMEMSKGTKFERSDMHKTLLVQETFDGTMAFGAILLRPDDTRVHGWYRGIYQNTDLSTESLGERAYDQMGNLLTTSIRSISFPLDAPLNQSETYRYMQVTTTVGPPPVTSQSAHFWDIGFAGFETLTLGGRRFDNVCIFQAVEHRKRAEVHWFWFAKGFGEIKRELRDTQGVKVPNSPGFELTRIITAP
ncbi:MAG: hypothetical protein V4632_02405 [Pseudomonadota bacterium]